jgi:hypothetical protein
MSDFVQFCPKCGMCFRDPDLFARHFAACGMVKPEETESAGTAPPDDDTPPEPETSGASEPPEDEKKEESAGTAPPKRGRPPKFPH